MLNAFLIVAFEVVIGVPIGLICGYYGGKIDAVIMRIWDVVCSIPSLLLSFILIAILKEISQALCHPVVSHLYR